MGQRREREFRLGWTWIGFLAVLFGGAWWASRFPRNDDLPEIAMVVCGAAFLGCAVQVSVHWWFSRFAAVRPQSLIITVLGYRLSPDWMTFRNCSASDHLINNALPPALLMCTSLASLALDSWLGGHSTDGKFSLSNPLWIAGWCWGCQAMLTLLPLPGGMGRGLLVASFVRPGMRMDDAEAESWANRVQTSMAVLLVVLSLCLNWESAEAFAIPTWPFIAMLGVLVWMTRTPLAPDLVWSSKPTVRRRSFSVYERLRVWNRSRMLRALQAKEFAEAADAEELDVILEKLHRVGHRGLQRRERRVLRRVSRRLRNHRDPYK